MPAPAQAKIPSGMGMLLKSLGIDPNMVTQLAGAIKTLVETLERIEANQKKILALLAPESENGNGGRKQIS